MLDIELRPAIGVDTVDYYLDIIVILLEALKPYEQVNVSHSEIIDAFISKNKQRSKQAMIDVFKQKAELEGLSFEEILINMPKDKLVKLIMGE